VFVGRADEQIQIRGQRVEPGEVEAVLATAPGVRQAAVTAPGSATLVAYIVADDVDTEAVRAWVAERLPAHMVPSAYVTLDAFPMNANGKVDRDALPPPDMAVTAIQPPRTPAEKVLCGLFAELLGRPVGIDDGFFDLGGHSLLALKLVARLQETGLGHLAVRDIFANPTVRMISARLGRPGQRKPRPRLVKVSRLKWSANG
jgi:hypothetical protein